MQLSIDIFQRIQHVTATNLQLVTLGIQNVHHWLWCTLLIAWWNS